MKNQHSEVIKMFNDHTQEIIEERSTTLLTPTTMNTIWIYLRSTTRDTAAASYCTKKINRRAEKPSKME